MSGQLTGGYPSHAPADVAGVLVVLAPIRLAGRSAAVGRAGIVVGRDQANDLVLDSPYVSRRHAWVGVTEGGVVVTDLDSANGTRVAGARVLGPTRLRIGDRLVLGDVEVELAAPDRLAAAVPIPTRAGGDTDRDNTGPTIPMPLAPHPGSSGGQSSRPRQSASRVGRPGPALALAVLGSIVGTVLTKELGTSQWGTLAGAAILPVVSATFTTRMAGEHGAVRAAAIGLLSTAALVITVTGVTIKEVVVDPSVESSAEASTTFPVPRSMGGSKPTESPTPTPNPTPLPGGALDVVLGDCDPGSLACAFTVTSTGSTEVEVRWVEVTGGSFTPIDADELGAVPVSWTVTPAECEDPVIDPGETCQYVAVVEPGVPDAGTYAGTVVVEHSGTGSPASVPLSMDVS